MVWVLAQSSAGADNIAYSEANYQAQSVNSSSLLLSNLVLNPLTQNSFQIQFLKIKVESFYPGWEVTVCSTGKVYDNQAQPPTTTVGLSDGAIILQR